MNRQSYENTAEMSIPLDLLMEKNTLIKDWLGATQQAARKLHPFIDQDSIIVGIENTSLILAYMVSDLLNLPCLALPTAILEEGYATMQSLQDDPLSPLTHFRSSIQAKMKDKSVFILDDGSDSSAQIKMMAQFLLDADTRTAAYACYPDFNVEQIHFLPILQAQNK